MPESFPTNSPEKAPSFGTKKHAIVANLEKRLKDMNARHDSIERSAESKGGYNESNPPLGSVPDEVLRDGGSDLSEWRAQVGHDRQGRYEDEDNGRELDYLARDISMLERDLEYIKSLEDYPKVQDEPDGDHDAKFFDRLFQEAEKAEK